MTSTTPARAGEDRWRRGVRRAREHQHFRVWTAVPVLGVASCVLLLTQQTAKVWLFAAILLAVGAVLYFAARLTTRRADRT